MISNFEDMLALAKQNDEELRLLLLFAKAGEVRAAEANGESSGTTSTLEPVICVDKLPSEIRDFQGLVNEADEINKDWDMVFVAALSGESSQDSAKDETDLYLNQMANDLTSGQNISRYLVFNRANQLLTMQVSS